MKDLSSEHRVEIVEIYSIHFNDPSHDKKKAVSLFQHFHTYILECYIFPFFSFFLFPFSFFLFSFSFFLFSFFPFSFFLFPVTSSYNIELIE